MDTMGFVVPHRRYVTAYPGSTYVATGYRLQTAAQSSLQTAPAGRPACLADTFAVSGYAAKQPIINADV